MIQSWLADQGLTVAPAVALLLFMGIFIGVLVWIFRPGSRAQYDHEARLPLEDSRDAGGDGE
jgi:cbb3-type cytochrome oxidase subunit 3